MPQPPRRIAALALAFLSSSGCGSDPETLFPEGGGGTAATCEDGSALPCSCDAGSTGVQTCRTGAWSTCEACVTQGDPCAAGATQTCICPDQSVGSMTCAGGGFTPCACAAPPTNSSCPPPFGCLAGSGMTYCADTSLGPVGPPPCLVDQDCAALGVACLLSPFGGFCFRQCQL